MIVLAMSPHPDDSEFGAGAYLARLVEEGHAVHVVAWSDCRDREDGSGQDGEIDRLRAEMAEASKALGVASSRCHGYRRRVLAEHRQAILDAMLRYREELQPDLVLVPSRADVHQDHATVTAEAVRAFRGISTLGYVLPWNCPSVSVTAWRPVAAHHVAAKLAAIWCYISQSGRAYARPEAIRAHLVTAGVQCGSEYAEPFEVIRWVE